MNRSLPLALAVTALAVTASLAGCGEDRSETTTTSAAATVDTTEISNEDLVAELEAIEGNTEYVAFLDEQAATNGGNPVVAGDGEFDTTFVSDTLRLRILYTIVSNEAAARELAPSEACREAGTQTVIDQYAQMTGSDGEAVLDAFGEDYREYLIARETDLLVLGADLAGAECGAEPSDEEIEAYIAANPGLGAGEVCSRHILVETAEEAAEIKGLLDGGADFATLAQERSIDTGSGASGGDLGCGPASQFVGPFAEAVGTLPIGVISDPVETEFGFHIIEVSERTAATDEEVRAAAEAALADESGQAFQTWFQEALPQAEVTLDPRFGTWDSTTGAITPPAAEITDSGEE